MFDARDDPGLDERTHIPPKSRVFQPIMVDARACMFSARIRYSPEVVVGAFDLRIGPQAEKYDPSELGHPYLKVVDPTWRCEVCLFCTYLHAITKRAWALDTKND